MLSRELDTFICCQVKVSSACAVVLEVIRPDMTCSCADVELLSLNKQNRTLVSKVTAA